MQKKFEDVRESVGIDEIFSDEASEKETDQAFKQLRPKAQVDIQKYVKLEAKRKARPRSCRKPLELTWRCMTSASLSLWNVSRLKNTATVPTSTALTKCYALSTGSTLLTAASIKS